MQVMALIPVVSGFKKKSVSFRLSWVLVAGCSGCGERGLLLVGMLRLLSAEPGLRGAQASVGVAPGARAQAQESWLTGIVAPRLVESSQTTDQAPVSCISKPIPSR